MTPRVYRYYLLAVLLVIYAFNGVDGLALGLVLQNIKTEMHLGDAQLGFLTGIAFAVFYSILGVPIARWADRGNRVTIIALTTGLWCAAVALCSIAVNFRQLLAIRIAVAIGEAGCLAPAQSLISDYFNRAERPRALSIYFLGASLSVILGYFVAGWVNELFGWRVTFRVLGLPGLLVAILAWLTLVEPRATRVASGSVDASPSFIQVLRMLWASRTFRHLLLGYSIASFFASGIAQWQPAFFIRSYGFNTGTLGAWFAAIYGVGGFVGVYLGGELATRFARDNEPLQLRVMALLYALFGMLSVGIYLAPDYHSAFALLGLAFIGGSAVVGPLFAILQTLTPPHMRATSIAILYLFANLVGLGAGPVAVGVLSDTLATWFKDESLRYALLAMSPGYLWVAWHLWQGSATVKRELAEVSAGDPELSAVAS